MATCPSKMIEDDFCSLYHALAPRELKDQDSHARRSHKLEHTICVCKFSINELFVFHVVTLQAYDS